MIRQDLEGGANILGGRFVLAIKNKGTGKEVLKARYVVQGHMDREKNLLVHNSPTVSQQSIRLLIAIATIFGFEIWSEDMTQAYLQGAERILRKVYIKGKPEFQLEDYELLEVLRPLYGLADAGDYWHAKFLRHLKKDLGMTTTASDLSFHFKRVQNELHGMIATHVDDTLCAGNRNFQKETLETARRFDAKSRELGTFTFAGVVITTTPDGSRTMHQYPYAKKLAVLDKKCSFPDFRSRRHELGWITHTRPDVAGDSALLDQVTQHTFKPIHVKQINTAIQRVKDNPELGLRVHNLNKNKLKIISYADVSFANSADFRTQLGFVVFLSDDTNRVNWIHFRSYKCKRVVRSVLAGETHAFVDAFNSAFTLRHDLSTMVKTNISLNLITDSDSLFKVIVQSSTTTEKRLMIDLQACREAYRERSIENVGWVKSANNVADGFTKLNKAELIQRIMRTGTIQTIAYQWVLRPMAESRTVN